MKKVLIGILIGLSLVLTYCLIMWNAYETIQLIGPKALKKRKYVKLNSGD